MSEADGSASRRVGSRSRAVDSSVSDLDQIPEDANISVADAASPQNNDLNPNPDILVQSTELLAPPLPPRPTVSKAGSLRVSSRATPTTALFLADVHTQANADTDSLHSVPASRNVSRKPSFTHLGRFMNSNSDADDSASLKSFAPTLDVRADGRSVLGDLADEDASSLWKALDAHVETEDPFEFVSPAIEALNERIENEFDSIKPEALANLSDGEVLAKWKAKLKHFIILSASGKPIYSRHGDDKLISHYVGVAQTLVSFYQSAEDSLKGFTAGGTRFVMLPKGPLNLLAVSRLGESDAQLRTQLESLYMQILSTLTLPAMEQMFSNRPSTDLRRPLQGTDVLLDGLADGFTRGSPSTLLSALECLRLRKTHRKVINETLLKVRAPNLLYGLIVAAGRLVSVVRPKKHSLHPGDLQLIFNMLFEAGNIKAGGGENWIPLCLPGFNNTGFLYMYVSFFNASEKPSTPTTSTTNERPTTSLSSDIHHNDELAIVLISANKEAFFEMRKMRDDLVSQLESNSSMTHIRTAIQRGQASCSEIIPGTVIRHFLYKSRGNVQFVMPSFAPTFPSLVTRRRLMTVYHHLHESIHSRTAHLRVQHCVTEDATALAWETPLFELYCIAGPQASRTSLAQGANRIVQWIRREEERVFIIGGAVF